MDRQIIKRNREKGSGNEFRYRNCFLRQERIKTDGIITTIAGRI